MYTLEDGSQVSITPAKYTGVSCALVGTKRWYLNGKRHRLDGHAWEFTSDSKEWWINGTRHRIDGPAYEGSKGTKKWWINGKQITKSTRFVLICLH
jgi:hypothetical protein